MAAILGMEVMVAPVVKEAKADKVVKEEMEDKVVKVATEVVEEMADGVVKVVKVVTAVGVELADKVVKEDTEDKVELEVKEDLVRKEGQTVKEAMEVLEIQEEAAAILDRIPTLLLPCPSVSSRSFFHWLSHSVICNPIDRKVDENCYKQLTTDSAGSFTNLPKRVGLPCWWLSRSLFRFMPACGLLRTRSPCASMETTSVKPTANQKQASMSHCRWTDAKKSKGNLYFGCVSGLCRNHLNKAEQARS
jgi:hypothetical protein